MERRCVSQGAPARCLCARAVVRAALSLERGRGRRCGPRAHRVSSIPCRARLPLGPNGPDVPGAARGGSAVAGGEGDGPLQGGAGGTAGGEGEGAAEFCGTGVEVGQSAAAGAGGVDAAAVVGDPQPQVGDGGLGCDVQPCSLALFTSKPLLGALGFAVAFAAVGVQVSAAHTVLGGEVLSAGRWALVAPLPFLAWGADELRRWYRRGRGAPPVGSGADIDRTAAAGLQ